MAGQFKDCCPTLAENNYHIRDFHPGESLTFEDRFAKCKVCGCGHDSSRCPHIHPLNRRQEENEEEIKKFVGPSCAWCHGKHLGINCPDRSDYLRADRYGY